MTIGLVRGVRGTRPLINFHKRNPIWAPRLHEIIKMAITPSVFVIDIHLDSMTIGVARGGRWTRFLSISKKIYPIWPPLSGNKYPQNFRSLGILVEEVLRCGV